MKALYPTITPPVLLRQLHAKPLQDLPAEARSRLGKDRCHHGRPSHDPGRVIDSHRSPLAIAAGGWGQIEQGGWRNSDEPDYQKMCQLVRAAIQPLPYHDIAGTCGRDEDCMCLSCWVRKVKEERQKRIAAAR